DHAVVPKDDERIRPCKSAPLAESAYERLVERHRHGDVPDDPLPREYGRLSSRGEDGRTPDEEAVDRTDGDRMRIREQLDHVDQAPQVAFFELSLEYRCLGDPRRLVLGRVETLLIGGEQRPH